MHSFEMCKVTTSVCQEKMIRESYFVAKKDLIPK